MPEAAAVNRLLAVPRSGQPPATVDALPSPPARFLLPGDTIELELHEVYENQTANQQEVVYYFSLPESAVITGL